MKSVLCAILLAGAACAALGQEIRSYTKAELYPGQICADDGPGWEKLKVGECPQGYNGLRNWAKSLGLIGGSQATAQPSNNGAYTTQTNWPYCNPCNNGNRCFEFKPGVAKCIVDAAPGKPFLSEGEVCLNFTGSNKKWKPAEVNPVLYGKSCEWPMFSCNWDDKSNDGTYRCQRVRASPSGEPAVKCYRAAGGRWWGGSDQWYAWDNGKFTPCGGPNPDYKPCTQYPNCNTPELAKTGWPWKE